MEEPLDCGIVVVAFASPGSLISPSSELVDETIVCNRDGRAPCLAIERCVSHGTELDIWVEKEPNRESIV